jgi:hypothetical protein
MAKFDKYKIEERHSNVKKQKSEHIDSIKNAENERIQ